MAESTDERGALRPRWLMVGASGRVGRLLDAAWRLAPPHAEVSRQYRNSVRRAADLRWAPLDGPGRFLDWCEDAGAPDVMIVLAGVVQARPGRAFDEDAAVANACLAAAAEAGVRRCLVASSAAVYGTTAGRPSRECDPLCPTTDYGRSKVATEEICSEWRRRGLDVTALRIGNVAGADALLGQDRPQAASPIVLDRFADGSGPVRSYIDPPTLASVLGTLGGSTELPPALNVAAPGAVAMADLLEAAGLPWRWTPAPGTALPRLVLDCGRLAALHSFPGDAAEPARIVEGWRRTAGV